MWITAKHGMFELKPEIVQALALRYPLANVPDQLLLAALWLEKNPARRPTKPLRFIENWLKKCSPKAAMVDLKTAQWWQSEDGTLAMAAKVGVKPSSRDSWGELRAKIKAKLDRGRAA